jgi:hypothetical protein
MISAGGAVENSARIRQLRRTIARILTVENQEMHKPKEPGKPKAETKKAKAPVRPSKKKAEEKKK